MTAIPTRTIAQLSSIELAYQEVGLGIPLLLIHGFCGSSSYWDRVVPALSQAHRVIVPDLRGHGQSSAGAAPCTIDELAEDLVQLLDHLNIPQAAVFGHSLGGYIALAMAERHPQRLLGLSLIHSTAYPDSAEAKANRDKGIAAISSHGVDPFVDTLVPKLFAQMNLTVMPEQVDLAKEIGYGTSASGAIHALHAMRDRPDRNHVLETFESPMLLLAGEHDQIIPIDRAFSVSRSSIDTVVLEQAGHMSMLELPEALIDSIAAFMKYFHKTETFPDSSSSN